MHLLPDHMSVFNYSITHRMGGEGVGRASPLYLYSHPQEQSPYVFITDIPIFWGVKKHPSISVLRTFCNTHLPLLCYK